MRLVVASGKGGTGKTTVALGLAMVADRATLVDCDVEEPDGHLFLGGRGELVEEVTLPVARVDEAACTHCGDCARACQYGALAVLADQVMVVDEQCHGCGVCSLVCPEDAVSEERRRIGEVRRLERGALTLFTGLLVKRARTTTVRTAKIINMGFVVLALYVGLTYAGLWGSVLGAVAISSGSLAEAFWLYWRSRSVIRLLGASAPLERPT